MSFSKNEGSIDRLLRIILAEIFFLLGFFWTAGWLQIVLYVFSGAMLITSLAGFCSIYKIFGIDTLRKDGRPLSKTTIALFAIAIIAIALAGSYYSAFFTKKFFLEDYNGMNGYYKQALFLTGQQKREEALTNYNNLISGFANFRQKYEKYHPYVISGDKNFNADLEKISTMISGPKEKITTGDLASAHLDLEKIRPVFQDILKRNGFSMLAVSLVDFHDSMEKIIAKADEKNAEGVISAYVEVNEKLLAIEAEANDTEIQTIRQNLEALLSLAKNGDTEALAKKAGELKSSFVKVYLSRG